MRPVYLIADSIASPHGLGTDSHWDRLAKGESGISLVNRTDITLKNFYASAISESVWKDWQSHWPTFSKLEALMLTTLKEAETRCSLPFSSSKTGVIISSTKGNIDSIQFPSADITLPTLAHTIAKALNNPNKPYVVSNACISGISAVLLAKALLQSNQYEQVVVCGADLLSEFTVSGFQCLHAISPFPCKPFDEARMGLSPGEACGVLVLGTSFHGTEKIQLAGGASSNDANHISGPSRTGDGLAIAIAKAIKLSNLTSTDIDYVSTHGTATLYNDESESKALALAEINLVPANSLKGYFGHTFGAAGVIETILSAQSIKKSHVLGSWGYEKHGVSTEMNIVSQLSHKSIRHVLKTASGFGSCNAALILSEG